MVDYDYAEKLPLEARQWLAAFSEEHYRGYRLKKETQVTLLRHLRQADATRKRVTRGEDVMAFRRHLDSQRSVLPEHGGPHVPSIMEFALLAGASGRQVHELAASNLTELLLVDELDQRRAERRKAERRSSIRRKR